MKLSFSRRASVAKLIPDAFPYDGIHDDEILEDRLALIRTLNRMEESPRPPLFSSDDATITLDEALALATLVRDEIPKEQMADRMKLSLTIQRMRGLVP